MTFWSIAASVLAGMMLSACLGILAMSLVVASSRASELIRICVHDRTQVS